ncbi:MAG TPA: hypothetical protein VMX74_13340 [Pirellulales bacterium]|nr:hypothetical protein [Pirellulales bacterium]
MTNINPSFRDISPSSASTPDISDWYSSDSISDVPDVIAPYLAAHGFIVEGGDPYYVGGEFAGWALNMRRQKFKHGDAIQDLIDRMTDAYNEGRKHNDRRYEDLIDNMDDLIGKAQVHMDSAKADLDDKISLHLTTLSGLETDYNTFFVDVQADLDGLTVTLDAERLRVNNTFDAQVAQSNQRTMNQGFYQTPVRTSMEAGIEELRSQQLLEIADKEKRLIADITFRKNEIYKSVLQMREGLIASQMGLTNRSQEFLAYQLDTRNNLALAMFKFVEAREDDYPGLGDMAALATSLGDDA